MIFGDGAAAIVVGVAPEGSPPDIEYMQTYASGPTSQVNSILWPNRVRQQHHGLWPRGEEARGPLPHADARRHPGAAGPDGVAESLLASIELIIPHQANKTMVIDLAKAAGLSPDQLYFNIERVGNASSASIPLAIHDAVRDQVIPSQSGFSPPVSAPARSRATRFYGSIPPSSPQIPRRHQLASRPRFPSRSPYPPEPIWPLPSDNSPHSAGGIIRPVRMGPT